MAGGAAGDVVAVRLVPAARIAIGGGEEHQHLLALADRRTGKLDFARRGPEECLYWAFEPHRFLEGVARQREVVAQALPLLREAGQAIDRSSDAVDGGVEPGRQQRAHQQRRLARSDRTLVDMGMNAGADATGREIVALALIGDIGLVWRRA